MLNAVPLLVATVLTLSGGDTVKKKAPAPLGKSKSAPTTASATIARAAAETMRRFAGPSLGSALVAATHSASPRATYLSKAIASHIPRSGPPLPDRFKSSENAVAITADSIVVEKSRRTMTLYQQGAPVRIYFVALGANPVGPKRAQGDHRTPEGIYHIAGHNPESKYHLSLKVSYPNDEDLARARAQGVTTGGDIMIHGLPDRFASYGAEHRATDWTLGCIAVTNAEIEEIWSAIPDGATIQIKP